MKIIKEGARYQGTCPNCGCTIECTKGEILDRTATTTFSSYCPECFEPVKVEPVEKSRPAQAIPHIVPEEIIKDLRHKT